MKPKLHGVDLTAWQPVTIAATCFSTHVVEMPSGEQLLLFLCLCSSDNCCSFRWCWFTKQVSQVGWVSWRGKCALSNRNFAAVEFAKNHGWDLNRRPQKVAHPNQLNHTCHQLTCNNCDSVNLWWMLQWHFCIHFFHKKMVGGFPSWPCSTKVACHDHCAMQPAVAVISPHRLAS